MTPTPPATSAADDRTTPTVPGYCVPCATNRVLVAGPQSHLAGYYCRTCGNYATLPDWTGAARVAWIHYLQQQHGVAAELLTALPAPTQPLPVTTEDAASFQTYLQRNNLPNP